MDSEQLLARVRAEAERAGPRVATELPAPQAEEFRPPPPPVRPPEPVQPPQGTVPPPAAGTVRTGDRWTYEVADRWRQVPQPHTVIEVRGVDADGIAHFVDEDRATASYSELQRGLLQPFAFGQRGSDPHAPWWLRMKPGESLKLTVPGRVRRSDGSIATAPAEVKLTRGGMERVQASAREHDAIRLDASGTDAWTSVSGVPIQRHWQYTWWYAPALRGFVAVEANHREPMSTMPALRLRHELLLFESPGGALAAR